MVRLEHGKPRYSEDISERFLAQEANQPHALHFSKGCYLGQEIVERVRSRGQIHRVLMPLILETKEPPAPGAKLQIDAAASPKSRRRLIRLLWIKLSRWPTCGPNTPARMSR